MVGALLSICAGGLLGKLGFAPFDEPPAPLAPDRSLLVSAHPSRVSGSISAISAARFVNEHTIDLRGCWRRLQPAEMMIVKAQLQLLVADDGTVSAQVTDSSQNPRIDRCLLQIVRRWELPSTAGATLLDLEISAVFDRPPRTPNSLRL